MAKSIKEEMKENKEKMKAKKQTMKDRLKGVTKTAATAATLIAVMLFAGCQTADPASRSNTATYGDLEPRITINGSSNYVHVAMTIGDGVIASADGGGDTQSNTPTQTTDVRPDIKAAVGAGATASGAAGNNPDFMSTAVQAVYGWLGANKGVTLTDSEKAAATAAATAACADGNCTPGNIPAK
jgi:hypothetical protein